MNLSTHPRHNELKQLKDLLAQQGCFASQISFYTYRFIILAIFLMLSIISLLSFDLFFFQIINAIFLAFIFGQIGLFAHDIVHRQAWKNKIIDMLVGNLFLGISYSWWHDKHNKKHHRYTNQPGLDQDIEAPFLAFTKDQVSQKKGFEKFIIRYQIYYLFLLFMFIPFFMNWESLHFLIFRKVKYRFLEIALLITHLVLFVLFLLLSHMSISQILIFLLISKGMFGVYLGSIFIVNHTGMPILDQSDQTEYFLSQIITARNIKSHPLTDFIMGGLNAQIEHHLFPQMSRLSLKQARNIVKNLCENYDIPYHETGFLQSFRETLTYLNSISSLLISK